MNWLRRNRDLLAPVAMIASGVILVVGSVALILVVS